VLDARRFISYLTIELKGWIPDSLRPQMGNWVFGCDICQEVCPFNRFAAPVGQGQVAMADWERAAPPIVELLALDGPEFARRYEGSPIQRIGRHRMVRNACVAAGNWGSAAAVPALVELLGDSEAIVRGHAAWALNRIGGREALAALSRARLREEDPAVLRELSQGGNQ
jgi:epoxyqueuosine reductase